ncbi:MAG: glycoside hydrolase [Candidatus Omnitrophica bacterium]|nr:glycoside hydrolase [Candidatus Omnitrophota bacterium]
MNESFRLIDSGFVFRVENRAGAPVACGPRFVLNSDEIICSFMVQSGLGINDFKPVLMRSRDGKKWENLTFPWKHLTDDYSIFGSISRSPDGQLFFFGTRTKIDMQGESFWSEATCGLKENQLIYGISEDNGYSWSEFFVIPKPEPSAAEAPGAMCITKSGSWHACYSPYNTFDPDLFVKRNHVILLTSRDRGKSWTHTDMLSFIEPDSCAAEAWVIEIDDRKLFGTCWKINQKDGSDYSNPFALSFDDGRTWTESKPTGIMGQTPAVAPFSQDKILFVYNQRRAIVAGIRLAVARVSKNEFRVETDHLIYRAERPGAITHSEWTNFSFGEPHVLVLPDRTFLIVFWSIEKDFRAIRYIRLDAGAIF